MLNVLFANIDDDFIPFFPPSIQVSFKFGQINPMQEVLKKGLNKTLVKIEVRKMQEIQTIEEIKGIDQIIMDQEINKDKSLSQMLEINK